MGAVYDANIGYRSWCTSSGCGTTCTDSTTAADRVTYYSNSANFLSILASSNDAYTTAVGGGYTSYFDGTSAASPYAAGSAAVVQSYAKSTIGQFYTPANLKTRLINNGNLVTDAKNGIAKPRVNISAAAGVNFSKVAPGYVHNVTVKQNGTLWTWGGNTNMQLGDGTTASKNAPVRIGTDNTWAWVSGGNSHSAALKSNGTLWAWGNNSSGQLGDGTTTARSTPVQIGTGNTWAAVAAANYYTVGLKSGGTLWAWGYNTYGQLGDGTTVNRTSPVQVGTGNTWVSVSSGGYHTLALKSDGTLWAWGYNAMGQLGDGTTVGKTSPVQVGTGSSWVAAAAGTYYSVALKSDGTLWAWGYNYAGQLGDGTTVSKTSPVQVGTGNTWTAVSAGDAHTVARQSNGTLWTWGSNYYGQLGDGTTVNKSSPVQIGTGSSWTFAAAGFIHSAALKSDGTLWAWGANNYGQLGDGTTTGRSTPIQVANDSRTLTVTKGGSGTGQVTSNPAGISCGTDCNEVFPINSTVTLNAVPGAGMGFTGWSGGGCSGTGPCTVTMSADTAVTANFTFYWSYGDWIYYSCGDDSVCDMGGTDTCNSDVYGEFTCPSPNGTAFSCTDLADYYFSQPDWWVEYRYRTVSCGVAP